MAGRSGSSACQKRDFAECLVGQRFFAARLRGGLRIQRGRTLLCTFAHEHCVSRGGPKWNGRSQRLTLAKFEHVKRQIALSQAQRNVMS
jgi:hypothetical protein